MSGAGASRRSDVAPEHLDALNRGHAATRTLAEALAMDHTVLLRSVLPGAPRALIDAADEAQQLGILKRMQRIGRDAARILDARELARLASHDSDTVRGWTCFAVVEQSHDVDDVLARMRPFADDEHFAVREWAWMAARTSLVDDLDGSIAVLAGWTDDDSERVRRFASEALRPRGVWASHIAALKSNPGRALPILEPLRADPSRYVQDSVANWINDAAKSKPDWARALCARWLDESPEPATERITKRGLRSL